MKRLALLLPIALVASCSGSSSSASGVSKPDYIKQAEVICAKANVDQKALEKPTAFEALGPYVAKVVAIANTATSALAALEAPKADSKELDVKVLQPLKQQLVTAHEYSDKVARATKDNDQIALVKLLSSPPTDTKADLRWMKGYGFKECVEAADTSD